MKFIAKTFGIAGLAATYIAPALALTLFLAGVGIAALHWRAWGDETRESWVILSGLFVLLMIGFYLREYGWITVHPW